LRNENLMRDSFLAFGRDELVSLRHKAKRQGLWFRKLGRIDRVLVDLAIMVTDGVRSSRLANALRSVVSKIEDTLGSRVSQITNSVGFPLARKLGALAQNWGNKLAREWMADPSYARFLAIVHINSHGTFS